MRTWWVVVAALGCGCGNKKHDDGDRAPPPTTATPPPVAAKPEAPPPKDSYQGKNRLINLTDAAVDVWVRRGFSYSAVPLAQGVGPWSASPWFGVPEHMAAVVLPAGAKPDAPEIAPMAHGEADEVLTGVLMASGGAPAVTALYDVSAKMMPVAKPPAAGQGALTLWAGQLSDHDRALAPKFGGRSFNVGDNEGRCRPQRDPKMASLALGGTSTYELELPPGKTTISLHRWPAPPKPDDACKDAVFTFGVVVNPDAAQWVFVYTPDKGASLATLAVPVGAR